MRVGLLQLNPKVGDLAGNAARVEAAYARAAAQGAELCLTPELAMTGYPPRDMLLYAGFARAAFAEAEQLAARLGQRFPGGPALLLGCPEPNASGRGKALYNAALLCEGGSIRARFRKALLPTYDVFDEARYFEPGDASGAARIMTHRGVRLCVTICEDLWNDKDYWPHRLYPVDPVEAAMAAGAQAIVNLSASPFSLRKQALRRDMLSSIATKRGLPLAYCNQVGGNDELVFDGRSALYAACGALAARAASFSEDVLVAELFAPAAAELPEEDLSAPAETWRALVLGTRDYFAKCGFQKALLGLSGGIDSAVVAAVAAEAVGPENVTGVLMPSPWSSQGSVDDSLELARTLGIHTRTIPIAPLMRAFDESLAESFGALAPGIGPGTTEENVQSRIRGNLLMALSNKTGALLLTTGNKSELAVGYCTIYGDMSGGFAVISDLPKTQVYALARYVNAIKGRAVPQAIIDKAPSAELKPDQTDQDTLPPYEVLDAILALHIEKEHTAAEIVAAGFEPETVARVCALVKGAEFKRRQAAPGVKVAWRSFGSGWRMPLAAAPLP
ncbi:NAD+ synthase (glutamine-hydrolysing) [Humidesulfovibrio mexicanus]|uniref:Glutamine-dependent NAD(+) synthetase n=1 Tax=Humidesulfovibrio mexicanus TaxID=147047 RepID=A0A239BPS5_9BACT|nr:NAD+ synthase [Humidesulfovibrio mexicanus]SNS09876.1 NAD+ synthase (glutamine-hydrolysing) [Humidesulfovibrio mexicanus]